MIRIAIDAMGGDFGADPIISGVIEALKETEFKAVLVGDSNAIKPLIPQPYLKNIEFIEATEVISMADGATDALKRKDSTIYKAVELLKEKEVDAVVSAGHSGATMSLATLRVGRLKNVSRPAIATLMPNSKDSATLVLDVGANVDCRSEHLFQFAIMGEAYAKEILGRKEPKVGLLSNGEEESKAVDKENFVVLYKKKPTKTFIKQKPIIIKIMGKTKSFRAITSDNVTLAPIKVLGISKADAEKTAEKFLAVSFFL